MAKGIGLTHPLPSLPLTSVLYTPECPLNLISISKITRTLNCSIIFSNKFVATPDFRRVIVVIPLRLIDTFSLLKSPSSRTHPSSPPPSLFLLLKSYPFSSSPRPYLMMYLLDHFRFIIVVTAPLFLSLLLRPLLTHFLSLQLLLPRLCLLLITYPLLFGKVIDLLAILILFTIF